MSTAPRTLRPGRAGTDLLALPPPWQCWVSLSNDPDYTNPDSWEAIHRLVWEELKLPFADSFFTRSLNRQWPDQVNLRDQPHILEAHPHDTMHTWGDYTLAGERRFTREDAREDLALMRELGAAPRVWTDHSNFTGNIFHRTTTEAKPVLVDAAGHDFPNPDYSIDLIQQAGVRYLWDGDLTAFVGQDREIDRLEWYHREGRPLWKSRALAGLDRVGRPALDRLRSSLLSYRRGTNAQVFRATLPDGSSFHCFRRHGTWEQADVDGLADVVGPRAIASLVRTQGTSVVYTHMGRRRADRVRDSRHIPSRTVDALKALAEAHAREEVMLSSTSRLLDYLVLRDSAHVSEKGIDFRPDGIRFRGLRPEDLAGFAFGIRGRIGRLHISCCGRPLDCMREPVEEEIHRLSFPAGRSGGAGR